LHSNICILLASLGVPHLAYPEDGVLCQVYTTVLGIRLHQRFREHRLSNNTPLPSSCPSFPKLRLRPPNQENVFLIAFVNCATKCLIRLLLSTNEAIHILLIRLIIRLRFVCTASNNTLNSHI